MHDFQSYRRSVIRYWEWRRIVFNLAIAPVAFVSYTVCAGIEAGLGADPRLTTGDVVRLFVQAAIAANVCYTFAYVLEFLFGSDAPNSRWSAWARTAVFVSGIILGMLLALYGGVSIANLEYGVK